MTEVSYGGIFNNGSYQSFDEDDELNGAVVKPLDLGSAIYGSPYGVQLDSGQLLFSVEGFWLITASFRVNSDYAGKGHAYIGKSASVDITGQQSFEISNDAVWVSTSAIVKVAYGDHRSIFLEFDSSVTDYTVTVDSLTVAVARVGYGEE